MYKRGLVYTLAEQGLLTPANVKPDTIFDLIRQGFWSIIQSGVVVNPIYC